ncbi:MAG: tRNA 2-thiocytidine biosynthesis protein TtcA [Chlamydiia bacterium]|nr:tRNA 2-thiocytidine biosynthesis protein TtcA [Chlamydiia bacterium]
MIKNQLKFPTPPWTKLGRTLESAVRKALYDYQLGETDKIAIALSGGKDSLTLLALLAAIRGKGFPNWELMAVHVSGAFSCGASLEGDWLKNYCEHLEVPLAIRESEMTLEKLSCYPCSRERRRLLFETAKEKGFETIAFGHHRDDNIQTLLMNLLHKGEFAGNLPKLKLVDFGVTVVRPLIYIAESEIRTFAEQQGFLRVMCRCPVGQQSMRRKVEQLLEEIEELYPHARENLSRAGLVYGSTKAERK